MGSGYGAYWADVMKWDDIKNIVPDEAAAFEQQLQAAGVKMDDFCDAMQAEDLGRMNVVADGPDAVSQAIRQIEVAWKRLAESFTRATMVEGAGLELSPDYHNPENGDRYDEVEGGFFHVEGVYQLSPAGKKYGDRIERASFVVFG
jgi:hypothetical protein